MTPKEQFVAELEPLLIASEKAINARDKILSQRLSMEVLWLARKYADELTPADFKEALNSPTANAIAERLGVKPRLN